MGMQANTAASRAKDKICKAIPSDNSDFHEATSACPSCHFFFSGTSLQQGQSSFVFVYEFNIFSNVFLQCRNDMSHEQAVAWTRDIFLFFSFPLPHAAAPSLEPCEEI